LFFCVFNSSCKAARINLKHEYVRVGKEAVVMRVYPNVSGLAAWSENCKWYS
jgi:hypothetical protein